jgi:hypothetical protein
VVLFLPVFGICDLFPFPASLHTTELGYFGFVLDDSGLLLLQGNETLDSFCGYSTSTTIAYLWLLAASGYWLIRVLVDLVLERRPVLHVNLTVAG